MAQKITTSLVDDKDGGPADETVGFHLDGKNYVIDLSTANANKLREALAEFIAAARKPQRTVPGTRRRSYAAKTGESDETPEDREAIRDWAREQGYTVSARGRISQVIRDAYTAAHSTN